MPPQQTSSTVSSRSTYSIFPPKSADLAVSNPSFSTHVRTSTSNSTTPPTTNNSRPGSLSESSDYFTTPTNSTQGRRSLPRVDTSSSISSNISSDSQTSSWPLGRRIWKIFKGSSEPSSEEENAMWANILQSSISPPTKMSELSTVPPPIPHQDLVKKADQETAGRGRVSNESLVIPQNFDDDSNQATDSSDG
ncbi:hypothetical protein C356_06845, partial [Cryptococcus neoformans c45]